VYRATKGNQEKLNLGIGSRVGQEVGLQSPELPNVLHLHHLHVLFGELDTGQGVELGGDLVYAPAVGQGLELQDVDGGLELLAKVPAFEQGVVALKLLLVKEIHALLYVVPGECCTSTKMLSIT